MKRKIIHVLLILALLMGTMVPTAFAAYTPPTSYGAPVNVGVVFDGDDLKDNPEARWGFSIGFSSSDAIRELLKAELDGRFEAEDFNSLNISVQPDYKLDNDKWKSEKPGYEDWGNTQDAYFNAENGTWNGTAYLNDYSFEDIFAGGILPGGNSYFDNHTMQFRVRFLISFYNSTTGTDYDYESPWSQLVSYSNNNKVYDPAKLINHATNLLSVELKKDLDGKPYLDFKAEKAHSDIQLLNNISDQRVYTNVWIRVNKGEWVDAGTYLWMKEEFTVEASDYFGNIDNYAAAVYEVKYRYSFDYSFYPEAGKSGEIFSPFSNVISHGMPAYEGASSWAVDILNRAAGYGFITDRIKGNMSGLITREEFAEIAVKLYEKYTGTKATVGNATFADTTNPEILKAANIGLVAGIGNNKYGPKQLVTREQMATILLKGLKVLEPEKDYSIDGVAKFADDNLVEAWAKSGVYYCFKTNIVSGVGNNKFNPDGNATREQGVIVCTKAYEFYSK